MKNFRVLYFESERGWGSDTWELYYATFEEARDAFNWTNSKNTSITAPDYYIMATNIQEYDNGRWKDIDIKKGA